VCLSVLPRVAAVAVGAGCVRGWLCVLAAAVTDPIVNKLLTQGLLIFPMEGPIISGFSIACSYVLTVISAYM
jgi:hypothetical protein